MSARVESRIAQAMLGRARPSLLMTDAYKFAMAQAGAPLRPETFYLSFRRPGSYLIPLDLKHLVSSLCPKPASREEREFLNRHGYSCTPAMERALAGELDIWAAPKGSWVREREPIVSISGPSFLASWLEPLLLWLHFPIQVATSAHYGARDLPCSSPDEASVAQLVLDELPSSALRVSVDEGHYRARVRAHAGELLSSLGGGGQRLFEVGMRSAHCMDMHRIALEEMKASGITKTSNLFLAHELGLTPVGTTGHEHQQRWSDDLSAFRAVRDMRPDAPSYLFDTYDALGVGIPAAITALRERPQRPASVRFDSGDAVTQLQRFSAAGVKPSYIFMDSMNPTAIGKLEAAASSLGIPDRRRLYGVGGFLVGKPSSHELIRDRVASVYKLSDSGGRPVMKFSTTGKTSLPGRPVALRKLSGECVVAQEGEALPESYLPLAASAAPPPALPVQLSPATTRLVHSLRKRHLGACLPHNTPLKGASHEHSPTHH